MPPKIVLLLLLYGSGLCLPAQQTFIKRYKNTANSEGSSAVCNLPGNRIAIAGNQSLWGTHYVPIVIIADSAGNQLRYFVDTSCYDCSVRSIVSDSTGFIYIAGFFFGKAGVAKYDTLGNKIWQRLLFANGNESTLYTLNITNKGVLLAGGEQVYPGNIGTKALVIAYNLDGDTLWSIDSKFGNTVPYSKIGVLAISYDSLFYYATGVVSDTIPQRAIFLRISKTGLVLAFKELNNGRKWGYGIIPISPDSILIGGRADNMNLQMYSFLSMVDSMGNIAYTVEDSNYLYNLIVNMDYNSNLLSIYDSDTLYNQQFGFDYYNHIAVYEYPFTSLQQPLWEKTITGATSSSSRGLAWANDGTVLHTATANNDQPSMPYLLKSNANTCADLTTCDTAFVSAINLPHLFQATFKLFPNPVSLGWLNVELQTDMAVKRVEVTGYDITGKEIELTNLESYCAGGLYKAKFGINSSLAEGVYFLRLMVNKEHYINGRFLKTK